MKIVFQSIFILCLFAQVAQTQDLFLNKKEKKQVYKVATDKLLVMYKDQNGLSKHNEIIKNQIIDNQIITNGGRFCQP